MAEKEIPAGADPNEFPTIGVYDPEVRCGRWVVYTEFFETVCDMRSKIKMAKCSCCKHTAQYVNFLSVTKDKKELPEFCPNCGAEMNVKMKEDDRNMAKWIPTEYNSYADGAPVWDMWECSECGHEHNGEEDTLTAFCPDCGAKMEGAVNGK